MASPDLRVNSSLPDAVREEQHLLAGPRNRFEEFARAIRIFIEYVRGLRALHFVGPCVTVFGSARFPDGHEYYELGRALGRSLALQGFTVMTGGGPGIMEAANRGAFDAGAPSIGFNITLPAEQKPNPYITPELCFRFHYFAMRKMHLAMRANALAIFPGGFGTMDELFELLTLQQTRKAPPAPVVLVGQEYWRKVVNFDALAEEGMISADDLRLFEFADTAEQAWESLVRRGLRAHTTNER